LACAVVANDEPLGYEKPSKLIKKRVLRSIEHFISITMISISHLVYICTLLQFFSCSGDVFLTLPLVLTKLILLLLGYLNEATYIKTLIFIFSNLLVWTQAL